MAIYAIKWLKDKLGTRFFPVTHINAVRDDTGTSLSSMLEAKQDTLVSGTNIKTVNNNSLVGSGNVSIATGDTNVIETVKVNNTALTPDASKAVNISAVTSFNGSTGAVSYTAPVTSVNGETGAVTLSIPSEVTESTVSGWGFTKNVGTITGITMNGASKGTSGVVNLGTVITSHQDISGKADKSTTTTAGTYKSVTVNSSGIVTGGSNPTTLAGYGITDAASASSVSTLEDYFTDGAANSAVTASKLSTASQTAWGQTYWTANGVPTSVSGNMSSVGNITMSGDIYLNNAHYLEAKDTGGTDRLLLGMTADNDFIIGYGSSAAGYGTYIEGNTVQFRYGTSHSAGMTLGASGNVGIGTTVPSNKLHIIGNTYSSGNIVAGAYLTVNAWAGYGTGSAQFWYNGNTSSLILNKNLVVEGTITPSSDERKKNIVRETELSVEDIASARSIAFQWRDGRDNGKIHGGSVAQDWIGKADEFIAEDDGGYYYMDYGALSLSSAITIAREVVQLKEENAQLKREIVQFKEENVQLKKELAEIKEMLKKLL